MDRTIECEAPPAIVIVPTPETRPTGLEAIRCLGREGIPVIALSCEKRPPSFASRYVSHSIRCPNPRVKEEEFVECLLALGRRISPRPVLFAASDCDVMLIARHQDRLQELFDHPYVPVETMLAHLDKPTMYRTAEAVGMKLPLTHVVFGPDDIGPALEEATWPSVVKGVGRIPGDSQRPQDHRRFITLFRSKAFRVHGASQLETALSSAVDAQLPVIVQEEIPGSPEHLYLVCIYADEHSRIRALFSGRKLRQYPADFGSGSLAEPVAHNDQLIALTEAFVRQTGYRGIANFEWKLDDRDGQYNFMEVNPRCWTWTSLAQRCSVNLPYITYQHLTTGEVPRSEQRDDGVEFVDLVHDLKYFLRYRDGDHTGVRMTLRQYFRSLKGPKEYAFLAADDRRPGWRHLRRQAREMGGLAARSILHRW